MNYSAIKSVDIANGPGVRVSLFVSGCPHRCKGCFNEETWDYEAGELFTGSTWHKILQLCSRRFIAGLSLLGGEPLDPKNITDVAILAASFKKKFPNKTPGHHPHWVKVSASNPADKWFWEARKNVGANLPDATYEAVGPHFQGNPYKLEYDTVVRHGSFLEPLPKNERTFEGIKKYLKENYIEGIVFWFNGEPVCKIKRTDFGFEWPPKEG